MKRLIFVTIAILLASSTYATFLQFSFHQHQFDTTDEHSIDSVALTLSYSIGPLSATYIYDVEVIDNYGEKAFSVSNNSFIVGSPATTIKIYFHPKQNIFYNSEIVFKTNMGDYTIDVKGQGRFQDTYYQTTENLFEEALKTELKAITGSSYTQLSYNNARDLMYMLIDNKMVNGGGASSNTLECAYTGRNIVGYSNRIAAQQSPHDFNTEHTWPQSLFSSALPMKSDLFHLFPTDITANSKRSNYPFAVVNSNISWQVGGSKLGQGIFEPRDEQKGQTARAMMYFVSRYQNYGNFMNSQESVLRQWHQQFPPDSIEINRNEDIYSYQNNRNPFIDHPMFVNRITTFSGNSVAPDFFEISSFPDTVKMIDLNTSSTYGAGMSIVNTGTKDITLTSYTLSDTVSFYLHNIFTADTIIAPGEAYNAYLIFTTGSSQMQYNEEIVFHTNEPSLPTINFQIEAEVYVGIEEEVIRQKLYIHTNNSTLHVFSDNILEEKKMGVYNIQGQRLPLIPSMKTEKSAEFDMHSYSQGIYLFRYLGKNNYIRSLKFIKE